MINDILISEDNFIKKGRMKKSPMLMSPEELTAWEEEESAIVRNYLFSIGQPLVYEKAGRLVAEYSNGVIEIL